MEHKLLIVDDEPRIYQALRRALHREAAWTTLYAESAEAALEVLESQAVDVLIADENMPGMNGTQLLLLVRQRWPEVIRMMLTGDARLDVVMGAVNRGEIYRFFTKPCNEAELIIAIRDALQMRRLTDESRRLLETVKNQSARIRRLEDQEDTPSDRVASGQGPRPPGGSGERAKVSLDEVARKGLERPEREVIKLGDGRADIDVLLSDIRSELDKMAP